METTKVVSKKKLLVPSIRFEGFDGFWINAQAADLFSNNRKKGNDSLPIYSVTLDQGMVPRNSLERRMGSDAKPADNLFAEKNDISYNMMRMWQGAYGLAPEDCMVSPAYVVLHPKKNISSEFFIQYFNRNRSLYLFTAFSYGLTSDRLRLYYKDFARIKFALPDFEEQQKIASFLSSIGKKIQQLTRKKELLEQYKKGVMQQLFSGKLGFKDENGETFPKWLEKRLGDCLKSVSTKQYQIQSKDYQVSGQYKVIDQGKDLIAGYSDNKSLLFTNTPIIVFGDHTTIIKYLDFEFIVGADGTKLLKNIGQNNLKYLFYNLSFNNVKQEGYKRHFSILSEIFLQIPDLKEQKKIANFLSNIDNKIENVNKQITQTQTFKKGLLQQMFV